MSIKPVGERKVAVLSVKGEGVVRFHNLNAAWRSFQHTVAILLRLATHEKYPGHPVTIEKGGIVARYEETIEQYDLREPLVKLSAPGYESKIITKLDLQHLLSGPKDSEITYEEVPAPVVTVGVCFVDDEYIGCVEAKEARKRTNAALTTFPGCHEEPIDFEKLPQPVNLVRKVDKGRSVLRYYETTTDKLEQTAPVEVDPGETQWTWTGQSGAKKYGKTRADFPTPFGFIRAERNLIAGHESYELLKGKFVTVMAPTGHRFTVVVKVEGKSVGQYTNRSRNEIARQYLPCNGEESGLMEYSETEKGFEAKIRPEGQTAFRIVATRCN